MPIISGGGGGGGNTTAQVVTSGKVLPVASSAGVTVDTTTYDDEIAGSGKLTTLVFPDDRGALAIALAGDAFPRWMVAASAADGVWLGNGAVDAVAVGNGLKATTNADGTLAMRIIAPTGIITAGRSDTVRGAVNQSDGPFEIQSASAVTSGDAVPTIAGRVGDVYLRAGGPPYFYFCTTAGAAGVAVWSTFTHAAPADASLRAGDLALWFDQTNGAAKLMAKAKTADGTIVAASVALA